MANIGVRLEESGAQKNLNFNKRSLQFLTLSNCVPLLVKASYYQKLCNRKQLWVNFINFIFLFNILQNNSYFSLKVTTKAKDRGILSYFSSNNVVWVVFLTLHCRCSCWNTAYSTKVVSSYISKKLMCSSKASLTKFSLYER